MKLLEILEMFKSYISILSIQFFFGVEIFIGKQKLNKSPYLVEFLIKF
jgi:hypothetical protein